MHMEIVQQVNSAAVYGNETYFQLGNAQLTLYSIDHGLRLNDSTMKLRTFEIRQKA